MKVQGYNRGRATTTVRIDEVKATDTDEAILAVAMEAAGEEPNMLFGSHIQRYPLSPESVSVSLYTD